MRPASSFNKPHQSGFALLITIVLMSMLVLIMVSFSSLTRVEIQIANNYQTQDRARHNALMALDIALGELQKNLGPDQRSTANAAIFTNAPSSLANADVKNPHWLGVFKTRDASNLTANLEEIRAANVGYETEDNLAGDLPPTSSQVTWLASLPKPLASSSDALTKTVDSLVSTTPDSRAITMVKIKDASTAAIDEVKVGYVPLKTDPNFPTATSGGFAWWVTDESLKAKVNKVPVASPTLSTAQQKALDFSLANKNDLRVLDNTTASKSALDPDTAATSLAKVLTPNQVQFVGTDFQSAVTPLAGDITTYSKTIPVDVSQGRLKQDLSAYLGQLSATVADSDPVIRGSSSDTTYSGPQLALNPNGLDLPTFGLIKNWARLTTDTSNPPLPQKQDMRSKQHFAPIVLRWGFTYQPGLEGGGTGTPASLTWRFKPAFVLWNPYNQPIAAADYLFQLSGNLKMILRPDYKYIGAATDPIGVKGLTNNRLNEVNPLTDPEFYKINSDFDLYSYLVADPADNAQISATPFTNTNKVKWLNFVLRGQRLEPGETIMLTPKYDRAYNNQSADWYVSQSSAGREAGNVLANDIYSLNGYNITTGLTAANLNGDGPKFDATHTDFWGYYWIRQATPTPSTTSWLEPTRFRLWSLSDPNGASIVQDFSSGTYRSGTGGTTTGVYTPNVVKTYMQNALDANALGAYNSGHARGANALSGGAVIQPGAISAATWPQAIRDNSYYALTTPSAFTGRTYMMSIGGMDYRGGWVANYRRYYTLSWMLQNARAPSMGTNFDDVGLSVYKWLPAVNTVAGGNGMATWLIGVGAATGWMSYNNDHGHVSATSFSFVGGTTITPTTYCLYHLPDPGEAIGSLGLLQHVNFSSHFWMPHYPFGNSSPMMAVQRDLFFGPLTGDKASTRAGVNISRAAIDADNALLDISTALNVSLWDRFFLSTLPYEAGSFSFNTDSSLPNSNHLVTAPQTGTLPTWSALKTGTTAFEEAASYVRVDGGFNVNSTSVAAWKLLLSGTYNRTVQPSLSGTVSNAPNRTVFPRTPKPLFDEDINVAPAYPASPNPKSWGAAKSLDNSSANASLREVDLLATAIVEEVKRRGPFLSLADFVNRRLIPDQTDEEGDWLGLGGTLQVAIDKVTQNNLNTDGSVKTPIINAKYHPAGTAPFKSSEGTDWQSLANTGQTSQVDMSEHMNGGTPSNRYAVAYRSGPSYLMQADVLQAIAPLLTVRGDTFVVRTYGEVTNPATGSTTAHAWCEAVVQRIPETVDSADNIIQPGSSVGPAFNAKYPFGRRMKVVMFRWLSDAEVAQVVGQ